MRYLCFSPIKLSLFSLGLVCLLVTLEAKQVGPWNLDTLYKVPAWEQTDRASQDGMTGILYESIPFQGNRVQVFAYYGVPEGEAPEEGWPAVVCVHGGGGTAFPEWVAKWNAQGYAAISMDLEGHYPIHKSERREDGRISTEHPGPTRVGVFNDFDEPIDEQWYYHAVAQVVLAHSLLRSFPEVNAKQVGLTGISWGGNLTSTSMGVDDRFTFAIPVYGCGFLPDSDGHQGEVIKPGKHTQVVNRYWDGSAYFQNVQMPTFWVNGTNDKHFPLPATQASSRAVQGKATLRYEVRMRHGHYPGWEPEEIYAFADSVVKDGDPLIEFGKPELDKNKASVSFETPLTVQAATLVYTTDSGIWNQRLWKEEAADIAKSSLSAEIPEGTTALFFNATDDQGRMVSSVYVGR